MPQLKNAPLWRSEKERIGNLEFNLWYAHAGTHCGIHNQHDFPEVHTQIYGIGRMQKFHVNHINIEGAIQGIRWHHLDKDRKRELLEFYNSLQKN